MNFLFCRNLILCAIKCENESELLSRTPQGLLKGHCYYLMEIREGNNLKLMKFRNPLAEGKNYSLFLELLIWLYWFQCHNFLFPFRKRGNGLEWRLFMEITKMDTRARSTKSNNNSNNNISIIKLMKKFQSADTCIFHDFLGWIRFQSKW